MSLNQSSIRILSSERVLIAGKTGSGKTTLARKLLSNIKRLVIVDSKSTLADWSQETWQEQFNRTIRFKNPRVERLLPPAGKDPGGWYAKHFERMYKECNLLLYIDELFNMPNDTDAQSWLRSLYTQGRERGIGVWSSTQRPKAIPLVALSEAEHFFIFQLNLLDDRKRIAEFAGDAVLEQPPDDHGYWYYNSRLDAPVYYSGDHTDLSGN